MYCRGRLYTFLNGGIVYCRAARAGNEIYSGRLGALGYYYSSPVAAGDNTYIASAEGEVIVLEAGDELREMARNNWTNQSLATPALLDGKIYIRTENHLYAFGN